MAPKPHLLNKQVDGSASSDITNKEGRFPRLDSALLIQVRRDLRVHVCVDLFLCIN